MKTIVFTGPSLSLQEGREILEDGIFLPPLRQADLITAITRHQPDVVVIVDDYSGLSEAVWHSEILEVINCGIKVYGTAAIGAVRAFEMDHCGMIGVGSVYQMFKDGVVEDDDEVLALFQKLEDGNFFRLSEPLVNLRATFIKALESGVIDQNTAQKIIAFVKKMSWCKRSLDNIFSRTANQNIPTQVSEKLLNFVKTEYQDVQKEDARQTLKLVKELEKGFCRPNTSTVPRNHDNPLWILYERDRKIESEAGTGEISLHDLAAHVVFDHPDSEELNRAALNRELAAFFAGFLGLTATTEDVDRERAQFMTKHQLTEDGALSLWLQEN
ncbi:MAG: TfuA-like protein, partial [Pseudomonadota bacterium]|nr:TfuA-like protein [Pseudomonadota bacterium]